jgi:unsaturated rhamnogalacturonyl hydrolase
MSAQNNRQSSIVNRQLLESVFRRTLAFYQPGKNATELPPGAHLNSWDWGPGIALYGLQKAQASVSAELQTAFREFLADWFRANLDPQPPTKTINGAMLLTVLWRAVRDSQIPFSRDERARYYEFCRERTEFYIAWADKVGGGAFAHTVAGIPDSAKQIWADNLMMLVLLMAEYAASESDSELFGEVVRQVDLHYARLLNPATVLLYHGWQSDATPQHLNGALWGRGNGWAATGIVELVALAQNAGFNHHAARIIKIALPHFEALRHYQNADGRWHTLLDKPESYLETSVTAAVGYAFLQGVRGGWLDATFAHAGQAAQNAVAARIAPDGTVGGVSGSTPLLPTLDAYNNIPAQGVTNWGQGLGLLILHS